MTEQTSPVPPKAHAPSPLDIPARGAATKPAGPLPAEPVMAFVRDAARGEITVMSGLRETTYRDPALAKRLLDAAR